jgi:hypothetical protein
MSDINILAVLVAAVSSFLLGGLWYSPVMFHNLWNREAGRGDKPEKAQHPGRVFGVAFVFAVRAVRAGAVTLAVRFPACAATA